MIPFAPVLALLALFVGARSDAAAGTDAACPPSTHAATAKISVTAARKLACAQHAASDAQARRDRRLGAIADGWTREQQQRFADLHDAATAFFASSAEHETVPTEVDREIARIDARAALDDAFVADIERFERGQRPVPGETAVLVEDGRLNIAFHYRLRRLAAAEQRGDRPAGAVTTAAVKSTEELWLAYREAWVRFGGARFPDIPEDAWRAWISHVRAVQLQRAADRAG